jgi:hypothetical protein
MLARFLLALMIALLPMPGSAAPMACHEPPPAASEHHHAPKQEPAKQIPAEQLCIGCVAPVTLDGASVAPPALFPPAERHAALAPGIARSAGPPATPPPRLPA